ncbi:MAG: hypothetical protein JKY37_08845, partial [Nannocystaceae bacterium]|nr:hypothetical protein [Nannocystaceae bacterium]
MKDRADRDPDRPELALQIAAAQDRMVDSLNATRVHRGARLVASATRRSHPKKRVVWIAAGAAAIAAVLVVALGAWPVDPVVQGPATASVSQARRVALPAGGSLEIAAGSVVSVQSLAGEPVRVVLEQGTLEVDSTQASRQPVDVQAGPFRVHSDDSRASIAWDPIAETLTLDVTGGRLVVESATLLSQQTIVAGDSVT